jgi:hypothetical protein
MDRSEALVFKQWDARGLLPTGADKQTVETALKASRDTDAKTSKSGSENNKPAQRNTAEKVSGNAVPQFCIHTAINDPTTVPEAPDRESIEVRIMALYL